MLFYNYQYVRTCMWYQDTIRFFLKKKKKKKDTIRYFIYQQKKEEDAISFFLGKDTIS